MTKIHPADNPADSVLSGFERVRLRAHRRRHRHKTINVEADELFEMFGDQLHRHQHRTRKNKVGVAFRTY
ncbi:hypothetical protein TELCIR_09976 [Teladorsagia circumcincta]|uniref:Uncharacterized protein n=1 Tax=Teladorsagia circumcincta TaxID=45464 RepID=A0A2G9UDK3_TELCI|nr:hypothetical protein TELCIR_09976 [Teladorsagia circumcincta]